MSLRSSAENKNGLALAWTVILNAVKDLLYDFDRLKEVTKSAKGTKDSENFTAEALRTRRGQFEIEISALQ